MAWGGAPLCGESVVSGRVSGSTPGSNDSREGHGRGWETRGEAEGGERDCCRRREEVGKTGQGGEAAPKRCWAPSGVAGGCAGPLPLCCLQQGTEQLQQRREA